jgi:hypothetical protein
LKHEEEADIASLSETCNKEDCIFQKTSIPLKYASPSPSFMVVTSTFGRSRPLYGGVYTIGEHGHGVYFPTWMAA